MDRWGAVGGARSSAATAWALGVGVVVAGLLVLAASSGSAAIVERAPELPWEDYEYDFSGLPRDEEPVGEEQAEPAPELTSPDRLPTAVTVLLWVALVGLVGAGVVALVRTAPRAWRDRRWIGWTRPPEADWPTVPDEAAAAALAVAADAAHQRQLLVQGTPRNAIVACWVSLEAAVASAGVERYVSDTSTELTERVLAEVSVDGAAIAELAALYREARFSSHPMGEAERAAAIAALDAVHAGLPAGVPT